MTESRHPHPNAEPITFRPFGLGTPVDPAVRRHRIDDRRHRDRPHGRSALRPGPSMAHTPPGCNTSSSIFKANRVRPASHCHRLTSASSVPRPNMWAWELGLNFAWRLPGRSFNSPARRIYGRRTGAMDGSRPPFGDWLARLRAWWTHRRRRKAKRSRNPSAPRPPAVSKRLVDPDRAAERERPSRN